MYIVTFSDTWIFTHGSCSHITGIPIRILCRSLSRSSREPSFSILIPFIKTSILQLFLEFGGRSRYFSVYSIYCKTEIILRTGNQTGYGCNKLSIGLFNIGHRIPIFRSGNAILTLFGNDAVRKRKSYVCKIRPDIYTRITFFRNGYIHIILFGRRI